MGLPTFALHPPVLKVGPLSCFLRAQKASLSVYLLDLLCDFSQGVG